MAFVYDAGLRIRPPEPMPDCLEGESPQDYFSRVLAQASIESATTAENTSGDSAPTPFNIGQVQSDLAQLTEDMVEVQDTVAEHTTQINDIVNGIATGVETFAINATSVLVTLPASGVWRIMGVVALEGPLVDIFVNSIGSTSFAINFDAAAAAGSLHWSARKVG